MAASTGSLSALSRWWHPLMLEDAGSVDGCTGAVGGIDGFVGEDHHPEWRNRGDFYASKGFMGWNKALERFRLHVGKVNSVHHKCYNKMLDLSNHRQSIQVVLDKHSQKAKRSFKRRDLLRHHQAVNLKQLFESGEAHTGQGLHQERGLQRSGDTRWRSYCKTLDNFLVIVSSIVHVLEVIEIEELNDRFDVVSSDLLLGMGSLNPVNSFFNFDKDRIMTLAKCYPNEFDDGKLRDSSYQPDTFIIHMRGDNSKFSNLQGIRDLAKALVEANLVETYSLVYLLVKLALILPVAMATVERAFSSMKHIKNEVRNSIDEQYLNNCLVCYIERDVFTNLSNDVIVDHFQNMKTRRGQL
ncbi:uncharacterized protein LOC124897690 [Capsicum annuum]|uniref:uncharacterized protein LOC124897690 n=1 Tax=Capsicum annuum TaxID=4072 RepID=UPI001FB04D28|nr:uncharacterized protein LOC124897690 [Capsicum annuum]